MHFFGLGSIFNTGSYLRFTKIPASGLMVHTVSDTAGPDAHCFVQYCCQHLSILAHNSGASSDSALPKHYPSIAWRRPPSCTPEEGLELDDTYNHGKWIHLPY
jgi:hypothetical protein